LIIKKVVIKIWKIKQLYHLYSFFFLHCTYIISDENFTDIHGFWCSGVIFGGKKYLKETHVFKWATTILSQPLQILEIKLEWHLWEANAEISYHKNSQDTIFTFCFILFFKLLRSNRRCYEIITQLKCPANCDMSHDMTSQYKNMLWRTVNSCYVMQAMSMLFCKSLLAQRIRPQNYDIVERL
jgi:hypothetical protein